MPAMNRSHVCAASLKEIGLRSEKFGTKRVAADTA